MRLRRLKSIFPRFLDVRISYQGRDTTNKAIFCLPKRRYRTGTLRTTTKQISQLRAVRTVVDMNLVILCSLTDLFPYFVNSFRFPVLGFHRK